MGKEKKTEKKGGGREKTVNNLHPETGRNGKKMRIVTPMEHLGTVLIANLNT